MARFRTTHSKGNSYLQFVESYRNDQNQPATRVLANLGNISNLPPAKIERLTESFIKAVGMQDQYHINNFTVGKGLHYGSCLPVIGLWQELNLESTINQALSARVGIPVAQITLIQIANRFSDLGSKLACYRWYENSLFSHVKNFVNFPDNEREKLHTYYRSLDYLCSIKTELEQKIYVQFQGYAKSNRLLFYDLTSVYFEGQSAELAAKGYSRDHRPDADQIVIGLVMNDAGIPLAHHVFRGNTVDKSTVAGVIADLENRFSIKEIIFVGDRGLLTTTNIETVKSHGNNYILGMQRRNRTIVKFLLTKVLFTDEELQSETIIIKELNSSQLPENLRKNYAPSVRFIICYDPDTAKLHHATRTRRLTQWETLQQKVVKQGTLKAVQESYHKLKSFLAKYKLTKLYSLSIIKLDSDPVQPTTPTDQYQLKILKNEAELAVEESLAGKFFLQTETTPDTLNQQNLVAAYKSLQKVERAFKFTKTELEIRPVYVRKEARIRGHVMICYLALLMETLLEKKVLDLFPQMVATKNKQIIHRKSPPDESAGLTMITLREELDTIRLVPLYFENKAAPGYISTSISNNVKKLFSGLGIVNSSDPKNLYFKTQQQKVNNNQLVLI